MRAAYSPVPGSVWLALMRPDSFLLVAPVVALGAVVATRTQRIEAMAGVAIATIPAIGITDVQADPMIPAETAVGPAPDRRLRGTTPRPATRCRSLGRLVGKPQPRHRTVRRDR
jgi:hypothetical protein